MWRLGVLLVFIVAAAAGYYSGITSAASKLVTPDEINTVEIKTRSIKAVVMVIAKSAPEAVPQGEDPNFFSSGFFYKPNLIVTNYHAINQDPVSIRVQLSDGRQFPVTIEAYDQGIDIAVLRVTGVTAPATIKFGNSGDVLSGQKAVILGSPLKKPNNVSVGVVGSFNRIDEFSDEIGVEIPEMMLTDANIEQGNSGGPILDSKGNLIGVVDANLESTVTATGKIGLGIPSNLVQQSLSDLEKFGVSQRGQLGATLKDVSELEPFALEAVGLNSARGALVMEVTPDGAGARAGLQASDISNDGKLKRLGDIILKVDNKVVGGRFDAIQEIAKRRPGQVLTLTVWRNKKPVQLKVTVTPRLPR